MIYLSQMLGNPVLDANGEKIGVINDLGIATGEVFPRVTSLAFQGPGKTPFMISWRKYVESFSDEGIKLKVPATDIRFSYLQPTEVLISRDLLNKQIVDTRGMRVVRVNDLKLSDTSSSQLRLLGAEVGARGLLRTIHPALETLACRIGRTFGRPIPERIIAWNYMSLLDRDLSNVKLAVSHKTLDELHPADIADIIEQLDPRLRGQVFAQLDETQAAEAMAELDDDEMAAKIMGDMNERVAASMLSEMDPDDAAELVGELSYEKAEKLLKLMGVQEERAIRQLLGYRENTAGRIMTSEFVALPTDATVSDAVEALRALDEDFETVSYIYVTDEDRRLKGVASLRQLIVSQPSDKLLDFAETDLITASPDDDQEDVAEDITKYNLLAMPVVDDEKHMLGIVTVDDALDVLEEEHEEDLQLAGGAGGVNDDDSSTHILRRLITHELWIVFWALGAVVLSLLSARMTGSPVAGLLASIAIPVCLRGTNDMVRSVIGFYLEFDEDDEDAPSILGFTLRGLLSAVVFSLLVVVVSIALTNVLTTAGGLDLGPTAEGAAIPALNPIVRGFVTSGITTVISFALSPVLLKVIRWRDEHDRQTSGVTVIAVTLVLTLVVFVLLAWLVCLRVA